MRLKFGAHQSVEATRSGDEGEKTFHGVYIAGQDYLCISLEAPGEKKAEAAQGHRSSGDFILILRKRARAQ